MGSMMPPVDRPEYDRTLSLIRGALEETRFAMVWAEATAAPEEAASMALVGAMLALG
jgi:hypothetical protein